MRIHRLFILILLAMLTHGAAAQEVRFVSSRHSPLKQTGTIEPNEVTFSGNVQVSGTFEVVWEPGTEGSPGYFRVVLRPNKASRAFLPHDSQHGEVREIWLRNTHAAIRAFLSPAQTKTLMSSHTRRATGSVAVILNSYRTGVDCDLRGYNASFVSVVRRSSNVVAGAPARESIGGC